MSLTFIFIGVVFVGVFALIFITAITNLICAFIGKKRSKRNFRGFSCGFDRAHDLHMQAHNDAVRMHNMAFNDAVSMHNHHHETAMHNTMPGMF